MPGRPRRHLRRLTPDAPTGAAPVSWLGQVAAAAGRAALRPVPVARREWAEALWAEAYEVPPGWPRLTWRAGGVLVIAKEGQMVRRIGIGLLFTAAAGAAAWAAWPQSPVPLIHGSADQGDVIITLALLAGLPLLTRWLLGPPSSRAARRLRVGCYAAILAIMSAKAVTDMFVGASPRGGIDLRTFDALYNNGPPPVPGSVSGGPDWGGEIFILFITACYVAVFLTLTARRASAAPGTLAIGARAGLALGLVMFAVDPLGGQKISTNPWLHGTATDPLVALAWVLLFCGPVAAGALAARRCHIPDDPGQASADRAWQGLVAGVVSNGVGALTVTVLGFGTTALLVKSAWVRAWLYHGQHLTASAIYGRELYATQAVAFYAVICVIFPIIGLIMGLAGAGLANPAPRLPEPIRED